LETTIYPGHGKACNGCGLCCLTAPCELSAQYGLWQNGACGALIREDSRYVCEALRNPEALGLAGVGRKTRERGVELVGECTHRAAFSLAEVQALLRKPNRMTGKPFPVAVVLHAADKSKWSVRQSSKTAAPTIEPLDTDPDAWDRPVRMLLSEWRERKPAAKWQRLWFLVLGIAVVAMFGALA
jgi:hypothetical protein